MARPERHDVDYFPFIVKRGKTLNILQSKYGLEGIGFFTNLFRFLAQTPDHYYSIYEEDDQMNFFAETGVQDEEKGLEMLKLMVKTGKLDKELWEKNKVIASEAFLESIEDAYSRRTNEIISIEDIRTLFQKNNNNPAKEGFPSQNEDNNPVQEGFLSENEDNNSVVCELMSKKDDNNPQTKLKDRIGYNTKQKGKTPAENPPANPSAKNPDDELEKACLSVGLSLTSEDTKEVANNLQKNSVGQDFIKFAYFKIQTLDNIKNPLGLLKHVCINPGKYQSYYLEYKKTLQDRSGPDPDKSKPPGKCPECGGELKATHNAVMCKSCKALFEYNPDTNTWENDKVLVKSIFD